MSTRWRALSTRDHGSALVAAVAVAVIGMAISTIVVAQAISVSNNSARDRIRTLEVHSAESGLDRALTEFATGAPCPSPSWSPVTSGSGQTATEVSVVITYFDANDVELSCASGTVSGSPTSAKVTSTATSVEATAGIDPVRTFQAKVELAPTSSSSPSTAIFAATSMDAGNGYTLTPAVGLDSADVWIDGGNYTCRQDKIKGNLFITGGYIDVSNNGCRIDGDVWVKGNYIVNESFPDGAWQITGDLTIKQGNFVLANRTRIQGSVSVGGSVHDGNQWHSVPMSANANKWKNTVIGGGLCSNNFGSPCGELPDYAPMGMPQLKFDLTKWQPVSDPNSPVNGKYFTYKTKEDFAEAQIASLSVNGAIPGYRHDEIRSRTCEFAGNWINSLPIILPSPTSSAPTIFDMRDCGQVAQGEKFVKSYGKTVKVKSDIVILANEFQGANGFRFESADGVTKHRVWLIVPWAAGPSGTLPESITMGSGSTLKTISFNPGNMKFSSQGLATDGIVEVFLYTPKLLEFPNISNFTGQMYGGQVKIDSGATIVYNAIGAPGLSFSSTSTSTSGFSVAVLNKVELRN